MADFLLRVNYIDEVDLGHELIKQKQTPIEELIQVLNSCSTYNKWEIIENIVIDKLNMNLFIRKISTNPVTGNEAFELVIVSIND